MSGNSNALLMWNYRLNFRSYLLDNWRANGVVTINKAAFIFPATNRVFLTGNPTKLNSRQRIRK